MTELLITGGTIVDGTGAPARRGDVRVHGGRIVEIGPDLTPDGEEIIDAAGALVTPGFIETHTHIDGAMWWDQSLDPLPGYGVTSVVYGNCGMSLAPLVGAQRDEVVDMFCFLEDLPKVAFDQEVPWTWVDWPEYAKAVAGQPTAVNVAGYIGHISLRTFVMGDDAYTRAATSDEIARMAGILDEALTAGALGISTNVFDLDRQLRPVPPRQADDTEFEAFFEVLSRHPGATFQCILMFNDPDQNEIDARRFAAMANRYGVRGQWTAIPADREMKSFRDRMISLHDEFGKDGTDFWVNVQYKPFELYFNFERSLTFQRVPAWHALINGPAEEKLDKLSDPAWREQARHDWDNREVSLRARVDRPHTLIFAISETGIGPLEISLAEYAEQTRQHVSDALADWLSRNGIGSSLRATPEEFDEPALAMMFNQGRTLSNINDTGAHLQLFCGAGESLYMIQRYHEELGLISLEQAVHHLTGRVADFFGFAERGVLAEGNVADIAVFALDEVEIKPEIKAFDIPGGSWRFTRPPGGFRATIVAGEITHRGDEKTPALPGTLLSPS